MKETTKEEMKIIENKLKRIHLDLDNVPNTFAIKSKVNYRPLKNYDNNYKVYRYVNIKDIEIYISKATRLDEPEKKYKSAKPIMEYLKPNEEDIETYVEFLEMVKRLDIEELDKIEKEQKEFEKKEPFEVRYKNNFEWDIFYSETDEKYFMIFPSEEENVTSLFYIIKKKIENTDDAIYVPINYMEPSYTLLKKSESADLENYLWYFTGEWPNIYEVYDIKGNKSIQIIGTMPVYEKVTSLYKLVLKDKEEAQEEFKLIKALFILSSNMEQEYKFQIGLDEECKINFFYNHNKITYNNLPEFIKTEIERKKEKINKQIEQNIFQIESLQLLQEVIEKKNAEYVLKEKQIVTFLECKKTFFGRISYYFKKKKKKVEAEETKEEKDTVEEKIEKFSIEEKEFYTIEDLLKVGLYLEEKEKEYKNTEMDIKALEIKKENLENKIKNATLYINEIENHKKSIFEFWKFTNKDEVQLLNQGEEIKQESKHQKIKRVFSYEDDIEDLGEKIDNTQTNVFSQKETDAIFAVYHDIKTFNLLYKDKLLKKDEKEIEDILKTYQKQYKQDYEKIKEKDFDIFGSVVEDKTKIKILKNNKHREIEKDKYRILNINLNTNLEEYEDTISNYKNILEEINSKIVSPYNMSIYKIDNKTLEDEKLVIMDMDAEKEVGKIQEDEKIILNRINVKEGMPLIFYSNIMFYDNQNQTLPVGMDISTNVLIDLQKFDIKLVSRKDFKLNLLKNEFDNTVKNVEVYEYDIELK